MFTETELREAMRHSAGRADTLEIAVPDHDTTADTTVVPLASRRRRAWLPAVAAAAVVAAASVAIAVTAGGDHGRTPAAGSSPSAASPSVTTPPPAIIAGVVDAVRAKAPVVYDFQPGGTRDTRIERISPESFPFRKQVTTLIIDIVRPSTYFDPAALDRSRPVKIAGTTGYYAHVRTFPLDGPDDDNGPAWTIAFPRPDGSWVFSRLVYLPNGGKISSFDDPDEIAARYAKVGLTFDDDGARLPVKFGYLPPGAQIAQLSSGGTGILAHPQAGHPSVTLVLRVGGEPYRVDIAEFQPDGSVLGCSALCKSPPPPAPLSAQVAGSDPAVVAKIKDSLTIATSKTDQSTWWTIGQAFAG